MSIHNFPEVYHGQGISKAVFSAPASGSQGRFITQHLVATAPDRAATSCVDGVCSTGSIPADPGPPEIGSSRGKRENYIG
ncbi:hypothetical protein BZU18_22705 [Salmonella enterica subsp. enterica serovar Shubra]|nr:hypothetical protein [Salmonella enterica subsp. enterica serovar Shubra]EHA9186816.1 hypothetical protein [Salmonella enterica subsp. enterica serovar Shubra]